MSLTQTFEYADCFANNLWTDPVTGYDRNSFHLLGRFLFRLEAGVARRFDVAASDSGQRPPLNDRNRSLVRHDEHRHARSA